MHFTYKDPEKGYLTNSLLLPKSKINVHSTKQALTFTLPDKETTVNALGEKSEKNKVLYLWDETDTHLIVPREFYPRHKLLEISNAYFPIVDDRPLQYEPAGIKAVTTPWVSQEDPLKTIIQAEGGTLNLRCGGGKTVLSLLYAAHLNVPTLIVVDSTALLEQWKLEIKKHLRVKSIGIIQGTVADWRGHPIVLAMVHTLAEHPEFRCSEFQDRFGLVVFDEGHHMSATVFVQAADLCSGIRLAITATAERTDNMENIYQYHLGRVFYRDLEQPLTPDTIFHGLEWQIPEKDLPLTRDKLGNSNISKLRTYLGTLRWRNDHILHVVDKDIRDSRNVMVLSHSVEQVRELYDRCPNSNKGMITGKDTDQKDRIPILKGYNPLFATFTLAREGLDKQELDTLHICTPFSNANDLQQSWGRALRECVGKQNPLVRVYEDVSIRTCTESCRSLRTVLQALGYPYKKQLDIRR